MGRTIEELRCLFFFSPRERARVELAKVELDGVDGGVDGLLVEAFLGNLLERLQHQSLYLRHVRLGDTLLESGLARNLSLSSSATGGWGNSWRSQYVFFSAPTARTCTSLRLPFQNRNGQMIPRHSHETPHPPPPHTPSSP